MHYKKRRTFKINTDKQINSRVLALLSLVDKNCEELFSQHEAKIKGKFQNYNKNLDHEGNIDQDAIADEEFRAMAIPEISSQVNVNVVDNNHFDEPDSNM